MSIIKKSEEGNHNTVTLYSTFPIFISVINPRILNLIVLSQDTPHSQLSLLSNNSCNTTPNQDIPHFKLIFTTRDPIYILIHHNNYSGCMTGIPSRSSL